MIFKKILQVSTLFLLTFTALHAAEVVDLPEDMKKKNLEIVQLFVDQMSKDLPKKIDNYTEFVNIKGDDLTIVYTFEISTGSKSDQTVIKEDHNRMEEAVTIGVCRSSKRFFDAQINISYIYTSAKSKAELFRFDITPSKCLKVNN